MANMRSQSTPAARQLTPYFARTTLAKLDQRTKEARLVRETRAAFVAHVGGKPSAVQSELIGQAVQIRWRDTQLPVQVIDALRHWVEGRRAGAVLRRRG